MAETPIYGITHTGNINDQFGPLRVIFASNRGTLVELGIGPIVTAGLILQVLSGSKMINVDFTNPADRALFTGASKVLSVFMTIFEGIAFLIGGAYNVQNSAGQLITPSLQAQFLILVQLVVAGVVIILLDEMLQKNWGFGSGISLFIAAGVCLSIVWSTIGPISPVADGKYFGATLFGNIFFIGQLLFQRYNPTCSSTGLNFWLSLFPGCFVPTSSTNAQLVPSKGLAYYTFAPRSITVVLQDPIRAAVYMGIFVLACVFFAVTWVEVGGMDSKTVAKQLIDSGMQVEGFRRSGTTIRQILDRYIPTVTVIGGIVIGTIAAGADFLGAFGTGTGILLTVGIIEQYYEILVKERITEIYPGVKGFLG